MCALMAELRRLQHATVVGQSLVVRLTTEITDAKLATTHAQQQRVKFEEESLAAQAQLEKMQAEEQRLNGAQISSMSVQELESLNEELLQQQILRTQVLCNLQVERARRLHEQEQSQMVFCPITGCLMEDPVVTSDGYTYERSAISAWLKKSNRSPMTNMPLTNKALVPNMALRRT